MVPSTQQPIERRPITSKQARRRWQKRGGTTISTTEKRRLEREAELLRRAEKIKDDERRKKENARKRKEKEEQDRETRKRMGRQEEIKLPEGQLGLGQFFAVRTDGTKPEATSVRRDKIPSLPRVPETVVQEELGNRREETESGDVNEDHLEGDDEEDSNDVKAKTAPSQRQPSIIRTSTSKQQQHTFTDLAKSTPVDNSRGTFIPQKPDTNTRSSGKPKTSPQTRHSSRTDKVAVEDGAVVDHILPAVFQRGTLSQLPYRKTPTSSYKQAESSELVKPRVLLSGMALKISQTSIPLQRSVSLPSSTTIKRDAQCAGFETDSALGADTHAVGPRSCKKLRASSLDLQRTNLGPLGKPSAISAKLPTTSRSVASGTASNLEKDIPITREIDIIGNGEGRCGDTRHEPDSFSYGLLDEDFDTLADLAQQVKSSLPEADSKHSHGKPLSERFDVSARESSSHVLDDPGFEDGREPVTLQKGKEETDGNGCSPTKKRSFARTDSTQSYGYDLSSQDCDQLEAIINVSPSKNTSRPPFTTTEPVPVVPMSKTDTSSFDDSFDLPGCTQALAALADVESKEQLTSMVKTPASRPPPQKRQRMSMPPPPIPTRGNLRTQKSKEKSMPQPQLPQRLSPRKQRPTTKRAGDNERRPNSIPTAPGSEDEIFDCFSGSTQAMFDLLDEKCKT